MTYWNGNVTQNQVQYLDDFIITNEAPLKRDALGNPMIGPSDWPYPGLVTIGAGPHSMTIGGGGSSITISP
jgi:hypothetical protein